MIAIISSTIYPPISVTRDDIPRTWISSEIRLEQTKRTIKSLLDLGISDIYLADNSGKNWINTTQDLLEPAKVFIFDHHQYLNKGISEIYLLLSILEFIPTNTPILKISGRYTLNRNLFNDVNNFDLAAKIYKNGLFKSSMSTRCYQVNNKDTYETFLRRILCEIYGYSSKIVGLRSFARIIYNSIFLDRDVYPYHDPKCSIESAAARVLKIYNYQVHEMESLGLEGYIAGNSNDLLIE